jgi:hypothetical protein
MNEKICNQKITVNIPEESAIEQYLFKLDFPFCFSIPVVRHVVNFSKGSVQKGHKGTITDIVQLSLANIFIA